MSKCENVRTLRLLVASPILAVAIGLCGAAPASAEPDKPKPKADEAIVAGAGQATLASNPASDSNCRAAIIGVLRSADGKAAKTKKTDKHSDGANANAAIYGDACGRQ
jgi:hypothetical protein